MKEILEIRPEFLNPEDYQNQKVIVTLIDVEEKEFKTKDGKPYTAFVVTILDNNNQKRMLKCFLSSFKPLIESWTGAWKTWLNRKISITSALDDKDYFNWELSEPPTKTEVVK